MGVEFQCSECVEESLVHSKSFGRAGGGYYQRGY